MSHCSLLLRVMVVLQRIRVNAGRFRYPERCYLDVDVETPDGKYSGTLAAYRVPRKVTFGHEFLRCPNIMLGRYYCQSSEIQPLTPTPKLRRHNSRTILCRARCVMRHKIGCEQADG
ncbi:hypothetical protein C8R47DRAFT_1157669 [Mycena vitilis]|nr:hypothetical protein C8R47DRAFT_1157669 [Mycena vitilis]